jgi:hypothetical protein
VRTAILIFIAVLVVSAAAFFLLKGEAPAPVVVRPKPARPAPKTETDFHTSHNKDFEQAPPPAKDNYADSFYKNSHLSDEFGFASEDLYHEIPHHDDYTSSYEDAEYAMLYEEIRQEELQREYEDLLLDEFEQYELERLSQIYADADVERFRQEEMYAWQQERAGHKYDRHDLDALPVERKKALKELEKNRFGDSKKGAASGDNNMMRLNQATKNESVDDIKKVSQKLGEPVALKESDLRSKFIDGKTKQVQKVVAELKHDLSLFQARKGDAKVYILVTPDGVTLEKALSDNLRKKVESADVLITESEENELKHAFEGESKAMVEFDPTSGLEHLKQDIDDHKGKKIVVALKAAHLFGDQGYLKTLITDGYAIKSYNASGELLIYNPK